MRQCFLMTAFVWQTIMVVIIIISTDCLLQSGCYGKKKTKKTKKNHSKQTMWLKIKEKNVKNGCDRQLIRIKLTQASRLKQLDSRGKHRK